MFENFVSTLGTYYNQASSYLKKILGDEEAVSTEDVLAAELEEIENSRKGRAAGLNAAAEVAEIKKAFAQEVKAKSAAAGADARAVNSDDVIRAEKAERRGRQLEPLQKEAGNDLIGLCFSGGGIRSATFNLGVITALARRKYLRQVDYLSTVSGGGYIGSWLTAWIKRAGCNEVERQLGLSNLTGGRYLEPDPVRFLRKYSNYLAPRTGLLSTDLWALLAVYLRNVMLNLVLLIAAGGLILSLPLLVLSYAGPVSATNQSVLLWATRILLLIAMSAIAYSFASFNPEVQQVWKPVRAILSHPVIFTVIPVLLAALSMMVVLARFSEVHPGKITWAWVGAAVYTAIWLVGSGIAKSIEAFAHRVKPPTAQSTSGPESVSRNRFIRVIVFLGSAALAGALGGFLLYLIQLLLHDVFAPTSTHSFFAARLVVGPPLLLWTAALVSVLHVGLLGRSFPDAKREWLSRFCAMLALTAGGWFVLNGLALYGAIIFKFLFASSWAGTTWGRILKWIVASGWLTATAGGVIGGNHAKSKPASEGESSGLLLKIAPLVFILGLFLLLATGLDAYLKTRASATPDEVAAAALRQDKGLANAVSQLVFPGVSVPAAPPTDDQYGEMVRNVSSAGNVGEFTLQFKKLIDKITPVSAREALITEAGKHWGVAQHYLHPPTIWLLALVLALVVLLFAWRLDVNEFSIHLLYRNRLARCYLGASRKQRKAQPFTGFDVDDDLPLAALQTNPKLTDGGDNPELNNPYYGPYHLVCTALNLVSGKELAWQTRKARSFIYSPLYCGYDFFILSEGADKAAATASPTQAGRASISRNAASAHPRAGRQQAEGGKLPKLANDAYRPTEFFSGSPGPYLGTAFAISGAAASPNMGYHSSPALTFLMGVFNVRLGWWAGNPRHKRTWQQFGPRLALYLGLELIGRTDDENAFVYLSDGGHFENLGLYELVRRKCRYIIASDGGCDPDYALSDLGNAIQKCRRDLGADILLDLSRLRPRADERVSQSHYAFGKIKYCDDTEGTLLYLKSSLTNSDRQDIQAFAREQGAFPHDSTANQFFNETRFESYRALGEDVFNSVVTEVTEKLSEHRGVPVAPPQTAAGLFTALEEIYTNAAPRPKSSFDLEKVEVAKLKFSFETE